MIPTQLYSLRYTLRKFRRGDAKSLSEAVRASQPELRQWMPWAVKSYSRRHARQFIRETTRGWRENRDYAYSIRHRSAPQRHLGNIAIWRVSQLARSAEIGYWIRTEEVGKGIGTEVTQRMLEFGFTQLNFNKIMLRIAVGNTASERIAEKSGFTSEGIMRDELLLDGKWIDHTLYSILAREWSPDTDPPNPTR